MRSKDEVRMAGPKSTQTRFVGIIISTINTSLCLLFLFIMHLTCSLSALDLHVGDITGCLCTLAGAFTCDNPRIYSIPSPDLTHGTLIRSVNTATEGWMCALNVLNYLTH